MPHVMRHWRDREHVSNQAPEELLRADVVGDDHHLVRREIRYRVEHYGYFDGFGHREWNASTPGMCATSSNPEITSPFELDAG